jgi:hypothetical protein
LRTICGSNVLALARGTSIATSPVLSVSTVLAASRSARFRSAGQLGRACHGLTIAFFTLDGGLMLGLYERTNLGKDARLRADPPSSTEFSLGIPATSRAEVDQLLAHVEGTGGTVTAPAHMRPFGVYSGYFTDPDGHLFEIAWDSN